MESSPVIARYLRYADSSRCTDREDELALVARARSGDAFATDGLLRQHIAFVIRVAMEFRNRGVPPEDLINEGCLGLLRAIRCFDPRNGARFMTYASFWVRKAVLDTLADQPRMVRVPRYQRERRQPLPREIRLDAPVEAGSDRTFGDGLADARVPPPGASMIRRETIARLRKHVRSLSARERTVLASRFGLHGEPAMTLMEVGSRMAISRERVRQIESAALSRLRRALTRDHASDGFRFAPSQM
jgi:RNA polymerase primary sigma factor